MNKFHLIIPMGGNGSRFSKFGFNVPKPLISIYGKPFFYWATMSLLKFVNVIDLKFVVLKEHVLHFSIDSEIKRYFPNAKITVIEQVLNGPVLTCLEGVKDIIDDYPIVFNDCDHLFKSEDFSKYIEKNDLLKLDGGLLTFKSDKPQYSYVNYDGDSISGTVEKKVVSNDAICGVYMFKSSRYFERIAEEYLNNCQYSEFYLSGMYNVMVNCNGIIKAFNTNFHVSFGTPEEYTEALNDKHYLELEGE